MILNEKEQELISKEIENLERFSSAELVAVITQKSSNYKYAGLLISIFLFFLFFYFIFFKRVINFRTTSISTFDFCRNKFII